MLTIFFFILQDHNIRMASNHVFKGLLRTMETLKCWHLAKREKEKRKKEKRMKRKSTKQTNNKNRITTNASSQKLRTLYKE